MTFAAGKPEPDFAQIAACTVVAFRFSKRLTGEVTTLVTTQVGALLRVMEGKQSREEIQEKLDLANREHFRKDYLLPALESGLIERTIPAKPNRRLQNRSEAEIAGGKYRLT